METVAKHPLLGLACVVLLGTCPAVAQRVDMTAQAIPEPPMDSTLRFAAEQLPVPRPEPPLASQLESSEGGISTELLPGYVQQFSGEGPIGLNGGTYGDCALGPGCAVCGGGRDCPPQFYVDQGTRILTRSRSRDELLTTELGVPKMSVQSMNFDVAAGYNITVGRYLGRDAEGRDHFWEFTYWGLNEWRETFGVNAETGFLWSRFLTTFGGDFLGGFNQVTMHAQSYRSNINDFELNVRIRPRGQPDRLVLQPNGRWRRECQVGCQMSYLFGIRGMAINEKYEFMGIGGEGAPWDGIFGNYNIKTHNNLIGLQIGGDVIFRHCRWNWGVRAKAGPYVNFCDQTSDIVANDTRPDFFSLSLRRFAKKDDAALVAEFGFVANYKLRPNLNFRASYDFMWIAGLALAPEQLDFELNAPSQITKDGSIYFHGLSLSAELIW